MRLGSTTTAPGSFLVSRCMRIILLKATLKPVYNWKPFRGDKLLGISVGRGFWGSKGVKLYTS